jgi:hypothetical protein
MTAAERYSRYPALPGFDKENRELVFAMTDAGWTGRTTTKGHYLAKAPDGTTTITVPAKNGNNRGLKNAHAQFMRWVKEHVTPEIKELWDKAVAEDDPLVKDVLAESIVRKQTQQIVTENIEREAAAFMAEIRKPKPKPVVRPYLARKHSGKDGGTRYESETTLERDWGNGVIDYCCAFAGCDYDSGNPRSVAMHYGQQHTRKGESEPAGTGPLHLDPAYTEPLSSRYTPTERLMRALMDVLIALDEDTLSAEDRARAILTWMHDRPDIEHEERPLVPLTDRQILDKVRMLVGQPDQTSEIEALRSEITVLESEVHRLREERTALRELLS